MSALTYQVEAWSLCWPDMAMHWDAHWREVATDQATMPLTVDMASYAALEASGSLHVVTVRDGTALVGYHLSIVRTHLHYQQTLCGFTDIYWLHPDYRRGHAGVKLFRVVETTLRAKGVRKLFTGTKVSLDIGRLLERLGYRTTERLYSKYLGDTPMEGP